MCAGYFFFHVWICMFALCDPPSEVQWWSPCGRYPGLAIWADEACQNIWNIWLLVLNSQLLSLFYHCLPVISLKASLPCNLKQQPHACDSKQTTTVATAELTISLWELDYVYRNFYRSSHEKNLSLYEKASQRNSTVFWGFLSSSVMSNSCWSLFWTQNKQHALPHPAHVLQKSHDCTQHIISSSGQAGHRDNVPF